MYICVRVLAAKFPVGSEISHVRDLRGWALCEADLAYNHYSPLPVCWVLVLVLVLMSDLPDSSHSNGTMYRDILTTTSETHRGIFPLGSET